MFAVWGNLLPKSPLTLQVILRGMERPSLGSDSSLPATSVEVTALQQTLDLLVLSGEYENV